MAAPSGTRNKTADNSLPRQNCRSEAYLPRLQSHLSARAVYRKGRNTLYGHLSPVGTSQIRNKQASCPQRLSGSERKSKRTRYSLRLFTISHTTSHYITVLILFRQTIRKKALLHPVFVNNYKTLKKVIKKVENFCKIS